MDFEVLAAIDLLGGRVVRLRRGAFEEATTYGDDPVATAMDLVAAGIRWLHVVDLDGARSGHPVHRAAIAAIVKAVGGRAAVEAGGGIRDEADAALLLGDGVSRVILGTAALGEPGLLGRLVARHGPDRVAAAIDVRDGTAIGEAWRAGTSGRDPVAVIHRLAQAGIGVFEVTPIDRDGTLEGPDLDLLRALVALDAGAIVAGGGIRSVADAQAVRDVGCAGAIIGRALYENRLDARSLLSELATTAARVPPG